MELELFDKTEWLEIEMFLTIKLCTYAKLNCFKSASSTCHAIGTDIPDPFSLPLPIVHRFRQFLGATPRIITEPLYVGSSWSPCFRSAMWRGPLEYITYELVPTSPAVSCMSGSSKLVFVIGGDGPYICCFVGCCLQDLFNIACSILV